MSSPCSVMVVASMTLVIGFMTGCREDSKNANQYEPNFLFAHSLEIAQDAQLDKTLNESQGILTEMFGTIDAPKLPKELLDDDYKDLISIANLKIAAGSTNDGLFAKHCVSCHGLTGQGRGTVAASQDPYPRDFRAGLFKYKSTRRAAKPVKEDLARTIRNGLSGTQMPVFDKLTDSEINALVDYVIYLSLRGELERRILQLVINEDIDPEKPLHEQSSTVADALTEITARWVGASDAVDEFELPDFPLVGTETEENKEALAASIKKGKELFANQVSACAKCHGESGNGIGTQLPDYDDWTKEWTSKINMDPTDLEGLSPLMARGGMKPQTLKARNIVQGHLRGGRKPDDIYRRIRFGIVGSPMPAAAIAESSADSGLTNDDVWHIVNYVLSIAQVPVVVAATTDAAKASTN